jgi:hypothetical protein
MNLEMLVGMKLLREPKKLENSRHSACILSLVGAVTIRRALDWMIGYIDTLHTLLGTTGNYSAIADLHTHFTVHRYTHTRVLNLH